MKREQLRKALEKAIEIEDEIIGEEIFNITALNKEDEIERFFVEYACGAADGISRFICFLEEVLENTQESKSKRLNLLVRPSTLQRAKEKAEKEYMSVNELCNVLLEEYANGTQRNNNKG